jgi:hypothetical protein
MKFFAVAVSAFTLLSTVATTEATFQSPPRGATYASSMVIGPDSIYYTGITYNAITQKPHCFLATSSKDPTDFLEFEIYGDTEVTDTGDSCRGVAVLGGQEVALVGTADPAGYFGFAESSEAAQGLPQIGFGMTVTADSLVPIKGATLSSFARVPYPQAVVGDPNDPNIMYVASMVSNQDTYNTPQEEFPDWTRTFQHGETFALTVEAFYPSDDEVVDAWTKYFPVDMENTEELMSSVQVGGMINKPGVGLIVVGSTAAEGEVYGEVTGRADDGFMAVLNPETGALHNSNGDGSGKTSKRFGSDSFDIVTDICDDPIDENAFYIVGATVGDLKGHIFQEIVLPPAGSLKAFIQKINANTLEAEWTVQLPAYIDQGTIASSEAFGCAVNNVGSVFVVGQVYNGAGMMERNVIHESKGRSDIWIARIDTVTAERKWIQQVGSAGDDFVARSGCVVVDADGNAIVYGNTNGNIYRDRMYAQHDLVVIRFDESDGYFAPTLSGDVPGMTKDIFSIDQNPQTDSIFAETKIVKREGKSAGAIVGIVFFSLAMCVLVMFFVYRRRKLLKRRLVCGYDGAASNLSVGHEIVPSTSNSRFGVFRAKNSHDIKAFGDNIYRDDKDTGLNYQDEPEQETNHLGNFHQTY